MTKFFVTFELERNGTDPNAAMLSEAEKRGWSQWIWGPKSHAWLLLPSTTLVGEFVDKSAAYAAFKDATTATAKSLHQSITLNKYLLGTCESIMYDSDEKVTSNR